MKTNTEKLRYFIENDLHKEKGELRKNFLLYLFYVLSFVIITGLFIKFNFDYLSSDISKCSEQELLIGNLFISFVNLVRMVYYMIKTNIWLIMVYIVYFILGMVFYVSLQGLYNTYLSTKLPKDTDLSVETNCLVVKKCEDNSIVVHLKNDFPYNVKVTHEYFETVEVGSNIDIVTNHKNYFRVLV